MNKVIATVGLAALSAASLQAQYAPDLTPLETTKPWSISATIRGFYDDNYLTLPKNYSITTPAGTVFTHPLSTWGVEVIPSATFYHSVEDTIVSATYVYDLRWNAEHSVDDMSHIFNGKLQHEFSERYKLSVSDTFVIAQEPTVIDPDVISNPLRVEGNNVHNTGRIDFTDSVTKDIDVHLGYVNSLYHYQQTDGSVQGFPFPLPGNPNYPYAGQYYAYPSYAADLDRIEQLAVLDVDWKVTDTTTGILGYQYGHTDYTSPEYLIYPSGSFATKYYSPPVPIGVNSPGYSANSRNSDQHFGFVGVNEQFSPTLTASLRVGGEYLDYYNFHTSRMSPYADANITDVYFPGCTAQVGVKEIHNSTDVVGSAGTTPVLDESSTAIYASDTHKITENLTATVMGQAQLSTFVGGGAGYDGRDEQFYVVQANLSYRFNPWVVGEAGYNFSKLNTDLPDRAYTRNFVYLGVRATY
jgi:Putative beta-barrel porin 2